MTDAHSTHIQATTEDTPKRRHATVQYSSYPPLAADLYEQRYRLVPRIDVHGFWLQQAGFEIGDRYTIEVHQQKLIIRLVI